VPSGLTATAWRAFQKTVVHVQLEPRGDAGVEQLGRYVSSVCGGLPRLVVDGFGGVERTQDPSERALPPR